MDWMHLAEFFFREATGYSDILHCSPQFLQANAGMLSLTSHRPRPRPSISLSFIIRDIFPYHSTLYNLCS
jgi:hypothetical protein